MWPFNTVTKHPFSSSENERRGPTDLLIFLNREREAEANAFSLDFLANNKIGHLLKTK